MPEHLIRTVFLFLATHLVILTLLAFAVVGAAIGGLFVIPGITPVDVKPGAISAAPPPVAQTVRPPSPPDTDFAPAPHASEAGAPAGSPLQPTMIGGTLPNYAVADQHFRPPAVAGTAPLPPGRDQLVQMARKAFWNGDFEVAETRYMEAISRFPEDADLFGELGNLYQSMGENDLSMEAYFEAGMRLRALGELDKLSEVISLLESHGYPHVARLRP